MGRKAWYFLGAQFLSGLAVAAAVVFPPVAPFVPVLVAGIEGAAGILIGSHAYTDAKLSTHDPKKAGK